MVHTERDIETEMNLLQTLNHIVEKVSEEEGFTIDELPEEYLENFSDVEIKAGDRCVDGRIVVIEINDEPTGYTNEEYNGIQLPAGTFGYLDALKKVAGLAEEQARKVVELTYEQNGFTIGAHIDDHHGTVESISELLKREEGCGNQGAKVAGKIPMHTDVSDDLVASRYQWVKSLGGRIYPLSGGHKEKMSSVNMVPNTTYNNTKAEETERNVFGFDIAEVYERAGILYESLPSEGRVGNGSKDEFQVKLTSAIYRDYLQTIIALDGDPKIHLRN